MAEREVPTPQLDMFLGELFASASKDDIASMEHPVFSIRKGGEKVVRRYENKDKYLEVRPPNGMGSATIWDKDVLIYVFSLMRQVLDDGEPLPNRFEVSAYDLLKSISRGTSGRDYQELYAALDRLQGTQLKTNIPTGFEQDDEESETWFSLVDEATVYRNKTTKRLQRITFKPSTWFKRQVEATNLLTIDPRYFAIKSGLERRLYELIRKHCGNQPSWAITLPNLLNKVGSSQAIRYVRRDLRNLLKSDEEEYMLVIDYRVLIDDNDVIRAFSDTPAGRDQLKKYLMGVGDTTNLGV